MIYDSILDTIGNTPVVKLNRIAPANIDMFVKIEAFNPMASVKDRLAFAIIHDAEQRGPFGAHGQAQRDVLDQGAGHHGVAVRDDGRPHLEARIGRVGALARLDGILERFLRTHVLEFHGADGT